MGDSGMSSLASAFIGAARRELERRHLKLRAVIELLDEPQLNWRPNAACNSTANLVAHLAGNIGERYLKTLGGGSFIRDRPAEFETDLILTKPAALQLLGERFEAADQVLATMPPSRLEESASLPDGDVLISDFIVQTLVHYGEHVGQAILLAKAQGVTLGKLPA